MKSTQNITLDLNTRSAFAAYIHAKQGDSGSRFVCAKLTQNQTTYKPPDGVTANLRCIKPDGNSAYDPAVVNDDGTVTLELTQQVLAVPGLVQADICLCNESGDILSTASFMVQVEKAPLGSNVDSSNELLTLIDMVSRGDVLLEKLGDLETGLFAQVEALTGDVADLKYVPIAFGDADILPATVEMGSVVKEIAIAWQLNKEPVSLTVDGEPVGAEDLTSGDMAHGIITLTGLNITEDARFSLAATDERDATASSSVKISFFNGLYYGVVTDGAELNSTTIVGDPTSEDPDAYYGWTKSLQGNRALTFTRTAAQGQRIGYALPARLGTPTFNVGGFEGGFSKAATIDLTNASGYTESYDVWLSDNTGLGQITVKVT